MIDGVQEEEHNLDNDLAEGDKEEDEDRGTVDTEEDDKEDPEMAGTECDGRSVQPYPAGSADQGIHAEP